MIAIRGMPGRPGWGFVFGRTLIAALFCWTGFVVLGAASMSDAGAALVNRVSARNAPWPPITALTGDAMLANIAAVLLLGVLMGIALWVTFWSTRSPLALAGTVPVGGY